MYCTVLLSGYFEVSNQWHSKIFDSNVCDQFTNIICPLYWTHLFRIYKLHSDTTVALNDTTIRVILKARIVIYITRLISTHQVIIYSIIDFIIIVTVIILTGIVITTDYIAINGSTVNYKALLRREIFWKSGYLYKSQRSTWVAVELLSVAPLFSQIVNTRTLRDEFCGFQRCAFQS